MKSFTTFLSEDLEVKVGETYIIKANGHQFLVQKIWRKTGGNGWFGTDLTANKAEWVKSAKELKPLPK